MENDPTGAFLKLFFFLFFFLVIVILISIYFDQKKHNSNTLKIQMIERALKDFIEKFRSFELVFSDQKKILQDYKYTLDKLDQEISRLADSSKQESSITTAINMANDGKSIDEISSITGMTKEEIEPIIKYHGKV
tara:strand:+ start:137 stop:541 length:405 start_codon:yes stop_codon:yes gene_type:complete